MSPCCFFCRLNPHSVWFDCFLSSGWLIQILVVDTAVGSATAGREALGGLQVLSSLVNYNSGRSAVRCYCTASSLQMTPGETGFVRVWILLISHGWRTATLKNADVGKLGTSLPNFTFE